MIPPPTLYFFKEEFKYTIWVLIALVIIRLGFEYLSYREFVSKPFYFTQATVVDSYTKTKHNYTYTVLKLQSKDLTFYTTTHKRSDFANTSLRVELFPTTDISFASYLSSFYVKSKIKSIQKLPQTTKMQIIQYIQKQHDNLLLSQFFSAIFFATSLPKDIREQISKLGISHLVALSGLHLGLLWSFIYMILYYPYKYLHYNVFPYRFIYFDLGFIALVVLGAYVYFVGYPPSLIRAYGMIFFAWLMLILGIEVLDFELFATVVAILLVLMPWLVFSIGFWLSVAGVFYIFLTLRYTKRYSAKVITFVILPFVIFLLMQPIVHTIFPMTTIYQLLSPIFSVLFTPFYIISIILHLFGWGGVFDSLLTTLLTLDITSVDIKLPIWLLVGYLYLSYKAIFSKRYFYILLFTAALYNLVNIIIFVYEITKS
jgi:competence protein ComEC